MMPTIELVIACRHAANVFDVIEKAFHAIAGLVDMRIELPRVSAVGSRWNHGLGVTGVDSIDRCARIVVLVGDDSLGPNTVAQGLCLSHIVGLPGDERPACRIAECIDQCMDLRREKGPGSSGSRVTLRSPRPLRTVLATFTAHGSSLEKAP
jgi:hypothetical protein